MFISKYYSSFLKNNYFEQTMKKNVDALLIDGSSIVKNVYENFFSVLKNIDEEDAEKASKKIYDQIFFEIKKILREIINNYRPNIYIFICFDGIPSNELEMDITRKKLFTTELKNVTFKDKNLQFDPNELLPGTNFSKFLEDNIIHFCKKIEEIERRKVIFSSYNENNIGRFKIVDFYEKTKIKLNSAVIFSYDVDYVVNLINIKQNNTLLVQIGNEIYNIETLKNKFQREVNKDHLEDYIFMIIFIMNNFLSQDINTKRRYEKAYEIYQTLGREKIINDKKINFSKFDEFLEKFSQNFEKDIDRKNYYDNEFEIKNKNIGNFDFGILYTEEDIENMCHSYLKCMKGILYEYLYNEYNNYKYEYFHPPLFSDISNFLKSKNFEIDLEFDKKIKNSGVLDYLFYVLPLKASRIIPEKFNPILNSDISYYYPINTTIEDKIVYLPFINLDLIKEKILEGVQNIEKVTQYRFNHAKNSTIYKLKFFISDGNLIFFFYNDKLFEVNFTNIFNSDEKVITYFDTVGIFNNFKEILYNQYKNVESTLNKKEFTKIQKNIIDIIQ